MVGEFYSPNEGAAQRTRLAPKTDTGILVGKIPLTSGILVFLPENGRVVIRTKYQEISHLDEKFVNAMEKFKLSDQQVLEVEEIMNPGSPEESLMTLDAKESHPLGTLDARESRPLGTLDARESYPPGTPDAEEGQNK